MVCFTIKQRKEFDYGTLSFSTPICFEDTFGSDCRKFVKKGAKRIGSSKWTEDIETVAFKNPDGSVVAIVLNRTEKDLPFNLNINGTMTEAVSEARSISTFIICE